MFMYITECQEDKTTWQGGWEERLVQSDWQNNFLHIENLT